MFKLCQEDSQQYKNEPHVQVRKEARIKKRRNTEFYVVKKTNKERLEQSSIQYMQSLLNKYKEENRHKKT